LKCPGCGSNWIYEDGGRGWGSAGTVTVCLRWRKTGNDPIGKGGIHDAEAYRILSLESSGKK